MDDRLSMDAVSRLYRNEWVLAEVVEEDTNNNPTVVKVIGHSRSKDDMTTRLDGRSGDLSIFFAGPPPKRGHFPHI